MKKFNSIIWPAPRRDKWIPFLLAMCMFSAAANIVALRTIHQLKNEIKRYEKQKAEN